MFGKGTFFVYPTTLSCISNTPKFLSRSRGIWCQGGVASLTVEVLGTHEFYRRNRGTFLLGRRGGNLVFLTAFSWLSRF